MAKQRRLIYGCIIAAGGIVIGLLGELFPDGLKQKIAGAFPFSVTYEAAWILAILFVVVVLLVIMWKYEGAEYAPSAPPAVLPVPTNYNEEQTTVAINPNPVLARFKTSLLDEIDRKGFAAVPVVLQKIAASTYNYDKPTFAGLQSDGIESIYYQATKFYTYVNLINNLEYDTVEEF
jgi:hypothetical protein